MGAASSPLVSVVTPFYNEREFLAQTIESVIAQTYSHWELILVDDGSPDGSNEIAQRYAEAYPGKIYCYHHDDRSNQGVCRSRNLGIAKARGEFVAYLDADDVWLPRKLEEQIKTFNDHPEASVLIEASKYWFSWEDPSRSDETIPVGTEQDQLYAPPQLLLNLYPLGRGAAPCPSGIIARKRIHDQILFVDSFVGPTAVYEDQAFLVQVYANEKVFVSSQANNLYRQRASSQVYRVHSEGRYHNVRRYFLDWLKTYLDTLPNVDPRVERLLKSAFFPYRYPLLYKMRNYLFRIFKAG